MSAKKKSANGAEKKVARGRKPSPEKARIMTESKKLLQSLFPKVNILDVMSHGNLAAYKFKYDKTKVLVLPRADRKFTVYVNGKKKQIKSLTKEALS